MSKYLALFIRRITLNSVIYWLISVKTQNNREWKLSRDQVSMTQQEPGNGRHSETDYWDQ